VLEDNDFALGIVNTILSRAGYTVLTAASESAAMSSAEKHKGPIQLLIADASVCRAVANKSARIIWAVVAKDEP